jgi:hypothetical protein
MSRSRWVGGRLLLYLGSGVCPQSHHSLTVSNSLHLTPTRPNTFPPPKSQINTHQTPQELSGQWERARAEEESRGAGALDVKRWTGIRNVVEGRELLRTLFKVAADTKAQVGGGWYGG